MNNKTFHTLHINKYIKIFTDGGSRGNPGPAGAGGVIFDSDNKVIVEISEYLGIQTNNYAEYNSLILTLKKAIELNLVNNVEVYMDSSLVINQINGKWKVKHPNIIPLYEITKDLLTKFKNITFNHVYRSLNTHADLLANKAMDSYYKNR